MAVRFLKIDKPGPFFRGASTRTIDGNHMWAQPRMPIWVRADTIGLIQYGWHERPVDNAPSTYTPVIFIGITHTSEAPDHIPIIAGKPVKSLEKLAYTLSIDTMRAQIDMVLDGHEQTITCCCPSDDDEAEDATEEK
ncbi:MAG: hypothetical protein OXH56_01880 [Gemmatimonadetes bacterium]|nr:hypothetical protein [Gemmatimonadota bacterium]